MSRPKRIILIRHGESQGNVDPNAYVTKPDWSIPLTIQGREQALEAGRQVAQLLHAGKGRQMVISYVSPYVRTLQTYECVEHILRESETIDLHGVREEPRIVEQQFGNFQDLQAIKRSKKERQQFGRFFYRFADGESGLDVYSRITGFITTLLRDCSKMASQGIDMDNLTVLVVSHGLSIRLFLMRWFHYTRNEFERTINPRNGNVIVMERRSDGKIFELSQSSRELLYLPVKSESWRSRIQTEPPLDLISRQRSRI